MNGLWAVGQSQQPSLKSDSPALQRSLSAIAKVANRPLLSINNQYSEPMTNASITIRFLTMAGHRAREGIMVTLNSGLYGD
jgi:hypothetical protein